MKRAELLRDTRYVIHLASQEPIEVFLGYRGHGFRVHKTADEARAQLATLDQAYDWQISELQVWLINNNVDTGQPTYDTEAMS